MSFLQRVKCTFGRHRLSIISRVSSASDHVGCEACGRQWGMNHDLRAFLPWDHDFSEMYGRFGYDEQSAVAAWRAKTVGVGQ